MARSQQSVDEKLAGAGVGLALIVVTILLWLVVVGTLGIGKEVGRIWRDNRDDPEVQAALAWIAAGVTAGTAICVTIAIVAPGMTVTVLVLAGLILLGGFTGLEVVDHRAGRLRGDPGDLGTYLTFRRRDGGPY